MTEATDTAAIPMQVSRGAAVVSVQVDLSDDVLSKLRDDLLDLVAHRGLSAVILDLAALEVLDLYEFTELRRIMRAVIIMGARPILAGLRPGVVAALVETGAEVEGLDSARDLDAAYALLGAA